MTFVWTPPGLSSQQIPRKSEDLPLVCSAFVWGLAKMPNTFQPLFVVCARGPFFTHLASVRFMTVPLDTVLGFFQHTPPDFYLWEICAH